VTRALSAELVVAVNLNHDMMGRGAVIPDHGGDVPREEMAETIAEGLFSPVIGAARSLQKRMGRRPAGDPGLASVMVDAFNITQDRIARARLAGDPPDVHIKPKLGRIGLFDFHRAEEAIALGEEAVAHALEELEMASEALTRTG
jgi:NTE family protein